MTGITNTQQAASYLAAALTPTVTAGGGAGNTASLTQPWVAELAKGLMQQDNHILLAWSELGSDLGLCIAGYAISVMYTLAGIELITPYVTQEKIREVRTVGGGTQERNCYKGFVSGLKYCTEWKPSNKK